MLDPFAAALGALFRAPGSAAAGYSAADGTNPGKPIRIIRTTATVDMQIGDKLLQAGSTIIQIQRSDVATPLRGDLVNDGTVFEIIGSPTLDVEQLTWNCEAEPA